MAQSNEDDLEFIPFRSPVALGLGCERATGSLSLSNAAWRLHWKGEATFGAAENPALKGLGYGKGRPHDGLPPNFG